MVNGRAVGLASKDEWSGHLGSPKTLKLYEGHFHDLLNDLGREQVMDDIIAWIEARLLLIQSAQVSGPTVTA